MDKKRVLFIYNPHAGRGRVRENLPQILDAYSGSDCQLMVHATQAVMDGAAVAAEYLAEGRCDHIICAGGDGTLDEVAGAVMESGRDVTVGVIPAGSTNDFGYSLGLETDMMKAADKAMNGTPFECDIATMNGRYYSYSASFGVLSDVSYDTPQRAKNALGHAAYLLNGMAKLPHIKAYHAGIETDAGDIEGDFILGLVVSSLSVGGFRGITGDDVELDDGFHELILIRPPHGITETGKLVSDFLAKRFDDDLIIKRKISRASFTFSEPVSWSLDGEFGGVGETADIQVFNRAIKYLR